MIKMRKISSKLLALLTSLMLIFVAGCSKEDVIIDDSKLKENEEENVEVVREVEAEDDEVVEEDVVDNIDDIVEYDNALTEEKYLGVMEEVLDMYSDSISDINKHMVKVLEDPTLLEDEKWLVEYESLFMPISLLVEIMDATEEQGKIPEGYHDMHTAINEALMYMEKAGEIMIDSIKNNDVETYQEGIEMASESKDRMDEVANIIEEKLKK